MNRFLWVAMILLFGFAPCSYADSVPVLNVTVTYVAVFLNVNYGDDNVFIKMVGPGTLITANGDMACNDWCGTEPITDLNSVSISDVFISNFARATVNGVSYDPNSDISISCCLPLGGGSVSGFVGEGDTFAYMNLTLPSGGGWNLTFVPVDGGYQFVQGEFTAGTPPSPVPEPGMLGLMGTGLAGILAMVRKRI
jgi:hypothetical protein